MSVDMHNSYNLLKEPIISHNKRPKRELQKPHIIQRYYEHNSQIKTILIDTKSFKNFYNFDISF